MYGKDIRTDIRLHQSNSPVRVFLFFRSNVSPIPPVMKIPPAPRKCGHWIVVVRSPVNPVVLWSVSVRNFTPALPAASPRCAIRARDPPHRFSIDASRLALVHFWAWHWWSASSATTYRKVAFQRGFTITFIRRCCTLYTVLTQKEDQCQVDVYIFDSTLLLKIS